MRGSRVTINKKRGLLQKIRGFVNAYIKVLIVFSVFILLVISCYIIMSNTLSEKLSDHVDEAVSDMQSIISSALNETKISLHHIADAIQEMIERGNSFETIQAYMRHCSSDEYKEKVQSVNMSIFGYFEVFGAFYDGIPWDIPEDYSPLGRPWYTNALAAGHEVAISKVYTDARLGLPVIFYSHALYDSSGKFLGVLCTDVHIESLHQTITEGRRFTKGSYGAVMDEELTLILHPHTDIIGLSIADANSEVARAAELIKRGMDVWMYKFHDYQNIKSLLFIRQIYNGWSILLTVPEGEYYKELYFMTTLISILCLLMASALSFLLVRIDAARSRADTKNQQKSEFLANMSHEMRTPMNVVVGLTDLMLEEDQPVNTRENLKKINSAGNTLMGLINDVLDISKIEAGKLELTPTKHDVPSNINDIVTLNLIRIEDKPITFKLDISENLPCTLYGDELRIRQIMNNLLSNAFKYTHKGTVTLGIDSRREGNDVWVSIYVSDTGVGIRKEDVAKLFTDYNQVDTHANRNIEGTGLGLSITKRLVELMDGDISVESEYGKGTTFRVRIRMGFVDEAVIGKKTVENLCGFRYSDDKKQTRLVRSDLSYAKVLLVDDFPTNLDVAAGMLRKYKMQVDCIDNGQGAVDRIASGEPAYDAVFMDHMMPGMDGVEATALIRAIGTKYAQAIPIIALTANAVAGNEQMFLDSGFNAYLAKPINVMVLDSVVQRWVRDKSRE